MFQMKKEAFSVLGKEGSTQQGPGFIQALWEDANGHFAQIAHLAKRDGQGNLLGVWGAMTDMYRSFMPWEENFQMCIRDSHYQLLSRRLFGRVLNMPGPGGRWIALAAYWLSQKVFGFN